MWRSLAGVVVKPVGTHLETAYGREINFNSWTALVDIPEVSLPIACSLKTCDICGDKIPHFRVAFYWDQPDHDLCDHHAISILICHTFEVDRLSRQKISAH